MATREAAILDMAALDVAKAVRAGRHTTADQVEMHLRRFEATKFGFALVPHFDPAQARSAAVAAQSRWEALSKDARLDSVAGRLLLPLAGVPVLVSDSLDVAGQPTSARCVADAVARPPFR